VGSATTASRFSPSAASSGPRLRCGPGRGWSWAWPTPRLWRC